LGTSTRYATRAAGLGGVGARVRCPPCSECTARRDDWFLVGLIFSFFGVLLPLVGILAARWLSYALGTAVAYLAGASVIVTGVRAVGDVLLADDEGTRQLSLSLETQSIA